MVSKKRHRKHQKKKLKKRKGYENNISMKKNKTKMQSFRDHLDEEYGSVGTESRDEYESGFEIFKLGIRLSTLIRIFKQGFGKKIKLKVE